MENLHIIWQDAIYEDEAQWLDAYEEYLNVNEQNGTESAFDDIREFIEDAVAEQLRDERENLDIDVPNGIIPIADLGLWNGRKSAYGEDVRNVAECLKGHCGGYLKAYVENGDLKVSESHHDGTNYYTFRKWRDGVTDEQRDELRDALAMQRDATDLIGEYTEPLGDVVSRVYGW